MYIWFKKILQRRELFFPPVLQVPLCPEWTTENRAELKKFLSSRTGQTLLKRARSMEANYAVKACYNREYDPVMVGGITFTLNWLEKLTLFPEATSVSVANSEDSTRQNADASLPEFATT